MSVRGGEGACLLGGRGCVSVRGEERVRVC